MRTWKIILACIVLSAASIFALAHNGSRNVAGGGTTGLAAKQTQPQPQQSTSVEKAPADAKSDKEYGWGPFRTTDW